jgi:hypothetical protein
VIDAAITQPSLANPPVTTASLLTLGSAITAAVSVWTEFLAIAFRRSLCQALQPEHNRHLPRSNGIPHSLRLARQHWRTRKRHGASVVVGSSDGILAEDLPESVLETANAGCSAPAKYHDAIRNLKKQLILNALDQSAGSVTDAATLWASTPTISIA